MLKVTTARTAAINSRVGASFVAIGRVKQRDTTVSNTPSDAHEGRLKSGYLSFSKFKNFSIKICRKPLKLTPLIFTKNGTPVPSPLTHPIDFSHDYKLHRRLPKQIPYNMASMDKALKIRFTPRSALLRPFIC
jgi:hypothetical protein